jgi:hypothetical protein
MLISKKLTEAVERLVAYTLSNEWYYFYEELINELEPNDTALWQALTIQYEGFGGYQPPHVRIMDEFKDLKISPEGILLNREEVMEDDVVSE